MRECLKRDPEQRECFAHFKEMKIMNKLITDLEKYFYEKNYEACVAAARMVIHLQGVVLPVHLPK